MKRLLVPLLLFSCSLTHAADRSHVVFVLADDLGWSDTTLRGTTRQPRTA